MDDFNEYNDWDAGRDEWDEWERDRLCEDEAMERDAEAAEEGDMEDALDAEDALQEMEDQHLDGSWEDAMEPPW